MRGVASLVVAATLLSAGVADAGGSDWATAVVTPGTAGHRATLTLRLHYEMTCGRPGADSVTVRLPAAMAFGAAPTIHYGTVLLDAVVAGSRVTAQLPESSGVTCMSIGPGVLGLSISAVRNPPKAGTYFVRAHVGTHSFTAQLAVRD